MSNVEPIRCINCGRFIGLVEFDRDEIKTTWTHSSESAYFGGDPNEHPEFEHKACNQRRLEATE